MSNAALRAEPDEPDETVVAPNAADAEVREGDERDPLGRTECEDVTAPFPERPLPDWKVLVMASEAYPEMERVVMGARRELLMGLHVFQGDTALRSDEAKAAGHEVWSDLLRDAMDRGVNVRILLTDFDPAGIPQLHVTAWRRVKELLESMRSHIDEVPDLFELQVVLPAGRVGTVQNKLLWPAVYLALRQWLSEHGDEAPFAPGWWPNIQNLEEHPIRATFAPPKTLSSTTLHQKFIVADGERGVVGGLDIDERRYDDPKHRRDAPETWHDVTVRVDGPVAKDLQRHFKECWDRNLATGVSMLEGYIEHHDLVGARARPFEVGPRPMGSEPWHDLSNSVGEDGESVPEPSVRLLRTMSQTDDDPLSLGPKPEITEIEAAYVREIGRAKHLIYLESQYLRSRAIRDALVEVGAREPNLAVVVLLPGAPEDVAFWGQAGAVQRYGDYLHGRIETVLRETMGDRFRMYCLVHDQKREEEFERDALYGRGMVYVHAKVMTVDDHTAIVGSANLNGRSMQWDTELCVRVRSKAFVTDLKNHLWREHIDRDDLGAETDGLRVARIWRSVAEARAMDGETGGAVPFPDREMHRFSKRSLLIPENMV